MESFLSNITTFIPASARYFAAVRPAGPAPAIATSTSKQSWNSFENLPNIFLVTTTSSISILTPLGQGFNQTCIIKHTANTLYQIFLFVVLC